MFNPVFNTIMGLLNLYFYINCSYDDLKLKRFECLTLILIKRHLRMFKSYINPDSNMKYIPMLSCMRIYE